ncbi:glycogen debranching N-terminal domain-containing protein [Actinopolymorpha singaporensis]|uniref:Glycogen debranching enzyme (Alpha-1,6-glucosidase) n=1 Tax=Actinopolymorpha singaporensis TaxID=117157 RepID=A0A1H1NK37_9ACTN|nr:glycogen debranching N-terminal domain-containing protein [Actinopolymorpha singaporensis]SDR99352.1 Glycogen debranching enzyme (alpha-1,6-glucosidase) [Actinopolymorpha singaporensis]
MPQPFLHELVSCVHAPAVALSDRDGQIRPGGVQGVLLNDRRALSTLLVDVNGVEPTPVGHALHDAGTARFVGVARDLGDPGADSTVRVERERRAVPDGIEEDLTLVNAARTAVECTVRVRAGSDLAAMDDVRRGGRPGLAPLTAAGSGTCAWAGEDVRVTLLAADGDSADSGPGAGAGERTPVTYETDAEGHAVFAWRVRLPARTRWSTTLRLTVERVASAAGSADTVTATSAFLPAADGPGWSEVEVSGPAELVRLVDRSVEDLAALALADPMAPDDVFLAAGSPWFFTLFGRDSLWAARLTLPLGTDLARGTLHTLARRQGTRFDPDTAEAPGKILHEVRQDTLAVGGPGGLPPLYFGTIDATALWISLLHDAWRWGMPAAEVAELLDPLEAALGWLTGEADADGDGFLEYIDESGHGLANQGWKDSNDSIQFPDGTIADPSIALSEAQAYAHEAAIGGAALLEAFGRPGADRLRDWAEAMRERFRTTFWVSDRRGSFPAIALDGAKRPVGTATSNLGHLLGTGLLNPEESARVAARMAESDLDSGYGLRTMSADAAGFNPLGYHSGSVWPHDTAIGMLGLSRAGHHRVAASLAFGLLRTAPDFAYRLPELFAGTDAHAGDAVLAYPASCRPQAWSAAASVVMLTAALGLEPDVPGGTLRVAPAADFAEWWPLRVSGLRVAGHPLTVAVDATGRVEVQTSAPVKVETRNV